MKLNRCMAAVLAAALSSCAALGGPKKLSREADVAGAEGVVRFTKVDRSVTAIDLRVRGLPDPEKLTPPGYVYIAWVRAGREAPPRNVGYLNIGPRATGELRALTEHDCSELFVTAEGSSDVERPSGPRLLWTN